MLTIEWHEFVGGTMMMISTAGQRVSPSGYGRGPIRKKHKRNTNILRAKESRHKGYLQ